MTSWTTSPAPPCSASSEDAVTSRRSQAIERGAGGLPLRDRPPLTLGTAGHIDHGKTALVTRLTGKNTDRLREERERGISIELGYAELELPSGARLSVVDVPGHERFVRTMVAGATGVDLFLLVIAADDGVMPQTVEHLAIIELLGVRDGVVALTKADLVDDELLELAEADVEEFLGRTPYAGCEVVTVSARDGRGLDELLAALERAAARTEAGRRRGPARLPVDRVFPLKGIGTVVTGTLWEGEIRAGDVMTVEPGGARAGVRSVQVHDHEAEVVHAGSRAGVNLRGLDRDDVRKGDWLAAPELAGLSGRRFDAWVSVLPVARPLRSGDQVRLHHGTAQYLARVAPLQGREIAPGTAAAAVVRLDAPALVLPHDRFIVRSLSPVATVAGGEVLLAGAHRWHARELHAAFLTAVRGGDLAVAVPALAEDRGQTGLTASDITAAGFSAGEVGTALAAAVRAGELEELPEASAAAARWFGAGVPAALRAALLAGAAERAAARPERPFSGQAELAAQVPALPAAAAGLLLQQMVEAGELVAGEGGYAPAGAGVLGDEQAALAETILARLVAEPLAPPTLASLAEELRRPPRELGQILDVLARRGDVVRVDKDLWFAGSAVDGARSVLLAQLQSAGEVTLAGFRDAAGCGRRNAQALLEYFDREGLTLRRGDVRVARRRRG
jgi:selenocysteine-specific elongation factor